MKAGSSCQDNAREIFSFRRAIEPGHEAKTVGLESVEAVNPKISHSEMQSAFPICIGRMTRRRRTHELQMSRFRFLN
jgi:hypothetical protein